MQHADSKHSVVFSSDYDLDSLSKNWIDLESRSEHSYFQSWGWISTWLLSLPDEALPNLVCVYTNGRITALVLLGYSTSIRHYIFWSRSFHVLETGKHEYDGLTIEHNGLLIENGLSDQILPVLMKELAQRRYRKWDEIHVSGLGYEKSREYQAACRTSSLLGQALYDKPFFFVDLEYIRDSDQSYLDCLSSNTRYQIRRALRVYETYGEIEVEEADTLPVALSFFSELVTLHQQYWNSKGESGAFGSSFKQLFHDQLIRRRFHHGEIQLLRIRAGRELVGYLYNFVYQGRVYNYQSAFKYQEGNNKLKPGHVSHYMAILYNLSAGRTTYDLLMGNQRYKRSLSTGEGRMVWFVIQKPRLRFFLEGVLIKIRATF